ncbi:MAG: hypothetical protein QOJ53_2005 [Sphingomonadales bacterium]|nr:hypothetical protein [Sphingomonadales bacterium]MEA3042212.1 hypothetical protein [Sphingomonadales bacterium]MEA3047673.1 hypothetical protein [Sphingomonadales bacterium]
MPDANQLQALGTWLAANLAAVYVGLFVTFAAVEAAFSKGRDPGSEAHGRLIVNFSLPIASALFALIIPFGVTTSAILAEQQQWGLFHQVDAPPPLVLLAALLSRTGLGYLVHRLSHRLPWLWRLHKVHHSDPHVDISLSLRHHPLELLPGLLAYAAGTLLLGLPLWSVALVEAVLIAAGYSDHLDIRLPPRAARLLRAVFVTPEIHHIHHSAERAQTDSNYGSLLVLWDRLFGTYCEPDREIVRRYGLDEVDARGANSIWSQLALPFARAGGVRTAPPETQPR